MTDPIHIDTHREQLEYADKLMRTVDRFTDMDLLTEAELDDLDFTTPPDFSGVPRIDDGDIL